MFLVRALRNLYSDSVSKVRTDFDESDFVDMPGCVVQGGVFSTVGGKSILRRVCSEAFDGYCGVASGNVSLGDTPYLLFADDQIVLMGVRSGWVGVLGRYFSVARRYGLGPNDTTVIKVFGGSTT